MLKKVALVITCILLLPACALKSGGTPSVSQQEQATVRDSDDMNAYYTADGKHRWFYPADPSFTEEESSFYIDGNACVFSDYILSKVMMFDSETVILTAGANCYDEKRYDGMIAINTHDITITNIEMLRVGELVKIYYSFPEGFTPTSYLDYLDYATSIEVPE